MKCGIETGQSLSAMIVLLALIGICQAPTPVAAQAVDSSRQSRQSVVELLTRFRRAAANADTDQYFDCLHKDGIFLGTDESERFTFASLKDFLEPYFSQGIGWKHEVKQRFVFIGPDDQLGWFEEHTERAKLGPMRTTGVVRKTDAGWKIVHSNVSLPIPNEAIEEVVAVIRKVEAAASAGEPKATSAEPLSAEQREQFQESFEYVWQKIRDAYWDPHLGGVDWQAAHDQLKPKLEAVATRDEAIRVLDELVSRMKVSHFSIIPKSLYRELGKSDDLGARDGTTGIDVRIVDDQVIVVSVTPASPAAKAGVGTGWIVEAIGDTEIPAKLAKVSQELKDNPHARVILASAANSRLRGRVGDEVTVKFRDGNNELVEQTLKLAPRRGELVKFGHLPEFRVWVDVKLLDDGIAYFHFNAFMNPVQVMTAYNSLLQENLDANGIIIDVRGNGGGNGNIAMGMIGWLLPGKKASLGTVILRNDELNLIVRPRPQTYAGPVVVLIDEMSVSAAEFFASGIKDLTEARLIGTRTAGAVLGSQIEKLPTGDGFQFAAANFLSIRTGETLEGVGVAPHQVVEPNRNMLLAGKDSAVEAAIEWIRSQHD